MYFTETLHHLAPGVSVAAMLMNIQSGIVSVSPIGDKYVYNTDKVTGVASLTNTVPSYTGVVLPVCDSYIPSYL